MRWTVVLVVGISLGLALPAPAIHAEEPDETLNLPLTIEQVWYRTERKRGVVGAKSRGDLTISESSFDYVARKESFTLALDTVHGIFIGKMRGDVDTDWVLLWVGSPESPDLIGFRDGRRMGYGQRTEEIYRTLRIALKQTQSAQYRSPAGYVPYDRSGREFAISIPEQWIGVRRTFEQREKGPHLGTTVFGSRERVLDTPPSATDRQRGDEVVLQRRPISPRLSCDAFGKRGVDTVTSWVTEELSGRGVELVGPLDVEATRLGSCNGVRVKGRLSDGGDRTRVVEFRGIADLGVAYLLSFETDTETYEEHLQRFERIVSTFQISPTRQ
ncbi:MAG: hypothetical protein OEV00_05025 [Acidobacteriota bacterium]|nr:hypothetical protein [Acidobacteriota bacterium]MDH3784677.1 hypothetical protein [Acidobacteriota bacterium]